MKKFNVLIEGSGPSVMPHVRALASLPNHFEIGSQSPPDVVLCLAGKPSVSAKLVVIDDLLAIAGPSAFHAFRYLPALQKNSAFNVHVGISFAAINIHCGLGCARPDNQKCSMVEQLAVIFEITRQVPSIVTMVSRPSGYVALASIPQRAVTISLSATITTEVAYMEVHCVSQSKRLHARAIADGTAGPAIVFTFDEGGATQAQSVHQNSHRMTWLAVHDALSLGTNRTPIDIEGCQVETEKCFSNPVG